MRTVNERSDPDYWQLGIAARLQADFPRWLVLWGRYTRVYWAFPVFNAPRGSYFSEPDPDDLASRMEQAEMLYRRDPSGRNPDHPRFG
jgi:hypothetical protein